MQPITRSSSVSRRPGVAPPSPVPIQPNAPVMSPKPQRAAAPEQHKTQQNPCDRGLQLKIEMAILESEYAELKPEIEAYCELNGGSYNSPLGSYSTRYIPRYEYPASIELQRIALKQAEERAREDGSAVVVNTTVSVAATITKSARPKVKEIR